MTLIIRYNPKENTILSDYTKMYSRSSSRVYGKLYANQPVVIVGSGSKSGIIVCTGFLSTIPSRITRPDEIDRLVDARKWNKKVWLFNITVENIEEVDIRGTGKWDIIKYVVCPRILIL
jgi:diphthamide synthase subunit DPH2